MRNRPGLYDAHMHSCHSSDFKVIPGKTVLSCAAAPMDWPVLLTERQRELKIFLGIHPEALPADSAELPPLLEKLSEYLHSSPLAGIGECGLDRRFYKKSPRALQEEALRFQIRLADRLSRPLNLHQVKASGALAEVLEEEKPSAPFIIHGFKEKKETAERFLRLGAFLSFGPGRHWEDESFVTLFRSIPRKRILLESDWPYALAPELRSQSEPAKTYAMTMNSHYETASAALGIDKEELCELVRENGTVFTD